MSEAALIARIAVGFGLSYCLGFERELRGSAAGDRTFALVGTAATALTAVAVVPAPQTVAGAVTGIGFIGAGVLFHSDAGLVKGITTAATLFAAAALGIVVGTGHFLVGVFVAVLALLALEIRYIPGLRHLDARRYRHLVRDDAMPPAERAEPADPAGPPP